MATAPPRVPWPPFSVAPVVSPVFAPVPLSLATTPLENRRMPVTAVALAHSAHLIAPIALPLIALPLIALRLLLNLVLVRRRLGTNIAPKRLRRREGH